jgi:hypothetical protein
MINKGLVAMNHKSVKSKWMIWCQGTRCDGEDASESLSPRYQLCHVVPQSSKC